ncbi:hypothetical protein GON01_13275 [Sphingomonas sp. MAH-20]|uniref:Uncharacterized protein n=1 Tax=Sphingomonas horti TaxID=2682842 RepID=A0A6I4J2Q0_9SPHN|nr:MULTISPECIES: hypothetical protein [Sphingomonas]MBA2918867.1 hypothetical protein [Sphingomonas sp. CGMCC 1.13658]MVO78900.1 hypothetical protein [Sphingomonas horti]
MTPPPPLIRRAKYLLAPWAGMLGAGFGWALSHQVGSDLAQDNCNAANPVVMILIGLIGFAIAGFGGLVSWRAVPGEHGGRKFVAYVGVLMAALLSVAIFMQTAAALLLPGCFG